MIDLSEFLLARIAEDEAVAQAIQARLDALLPGVPWRAFVQVANPAITEFKAAHSPARVLAECDAKRRLIEIDGRQAKDKGVLAALALPYADHPDYDEAWRP